MKEATSEQWLCLEALSRQGAILRPPMGKETLCDAVCGVLKDDLEAQRRCISQCRLLEPLVEAYAVERFEYRIYVRLYVLVDRVEEVTRHAQRLWLDMDAGERWARLEIHAIDGRGRCRMDVALSSGRWATGTAPPYRSGL